MKVLNAAETVSIRITPISRASFEPWYQSAKKEKIRNPALCIMGRLSMVDFVRKAMKHLRIGTPEPELDAMSPLDLLRVYGHVCNGWGHYSAQLVAIRHFCQANNMLAAEEETVTARVALQDDRAVALAGKIEAKLKLLLKPK
jgi:hypothetical protein